MTRRAQVPLTQYLPEVRSVQDERHAASVAKQRDVAMLLRIAGPRGALLRELAQAVGVTRATVRRYVRCGEYLAPLVGSIGHGPRRRVYLLETRMDVPGPVPEHKRADLRLLARTWAWHNNMPWEAQAWLHGWRQPSGRSSS